MPDCRLWAGSKNNSPNPPALHMSYTLTMCRSACARRPSTLPSFLHAATTSSLTALPAFPPPAHSACPSLALLPCCSSAGGAAPEADAELSPLHGLQHSMSGVFLRSAEESVMSNSTGAQVMFLWGHTAPNGVR